MNCLFCKIIAGEIPSKMVYQDQKLIAIEDVNPAAPLHLLLLPRKHIANVLDLLPEDDLLIGHLFRVASALAKERGYDESGFRIVTNTNADAGQSVLHIHFHLLAGRNMQWPPG
jgi:histidine triad (HIT) family protein